MPLLAVVTVACTATAPPSTSSSTTTSTITTSSVAPTTSPPSACQGSFAARGPVARFTDAAGDAVNITAIISESLDGCDRTTIELSTPAGAPATGTGPVTVEWLEDQGIVRVRFASVTGTVVSDQILESPILDRVYVVRSLDGALFVDLVASQPAAAQATLENEPARVIVELVADASGSDTGPSISSLVVVTSSVGVPAEYPLRIEGYSRTFEATVLARIDDELVGIATAADWLETWGEFRFAITDGPESPTELFVGADPPDGGDSIGVIIPLR